MRNFGSNIDNDYNWIRGTVKFMFILIFVLVLAQIFLYVWAGITILNEPEAAGEVIGKVGKGIKKGLE